jgi:hypothetical protein
MGPDCSDPWWLPYAVVALLEAVCGLILVAFLLANWPEVSRSLRWSNV